MTPEQEKAVQDYVRTEAIIELFTGLGDEFCPDFDGYELVRPDDIRDVEFGNFCEAFEDDEDVIEKVQADIKPDIARLKQKLRQLIASELASPG